MLLSQWEGESRRVPTNPHMGHSTLRHCWQWMYPALENTCGIPQLMLTSCELGPNWNTPLFDPSHQPAAVRDANFLSTSKVRVAILMWWFTKRIHCSVHHIRNSDTAELLGQDANFPSHCTFYAVSSSSVLQWPPQRCNLPRLTRTKANVERAIPQCHQEVERGCKSNMCFECAQQTLHPNWRQQFCPQQRPDPDRNTTYPWLSNNGSTWPLSI